MDLGNSGRSVTDEGDEQVTTIPSSLLKLGINQVRDNMASGESLSPKHVSRQFVLLFRRELEARLFSQPLAKTTKGEPPCAP